MSQTKLLLEERALSGHGHFDMSAYEAYFAGKLQDYDYPAEAVEKALAELPQVGS